MTSGSRSISRKPLSGRRIAESPPPYVARVLYVESSALIAALLEGERCVDDLAGALEMTHSAISHQLQLLRNLRVVRYRKEGRHVFYALDDAHIQGLLLQSLEHARHG